MAISALDGHGMWRANARGPASVVHGGWLLVEPVFRRGNHTFRVSQ